MKTTTTWAQVMPGDIVRTSSGRFMIQNIHDGEFAMCDERLVVHRGRPQLGTSVTIERRGTTEMEAAISCVEAVLGGVRISAGVL